MVHQVEDRHRTNTDVCFIIMAWVLQLGEDKAIIRLIMETIVPREALGGFDEILAKSIPKLGINLGDKYNNLEKIEAMKYSPFVLCFDEDSRTKGLEKPGKAGW